MQGHAEVCPCISIHRVLFMSHSQRAVLLLSGGMDSTTLLWWMKDRGIAEIHTVAIDYGQRHKIELESSRI